jgi:hypothetical protein
MVDVEDVSFELRLCVLPWMAPFDPFSRYYTQFMFLMREMVEQDILTDDVFTHL